MPASIWPVFLHPIFTFSFLGSYKSGLILLCSYETSSVGWLLQEALRRCANRGIERSGPQLLTTVDGAELDSDDLVWDVLRDGEKVSEIKGSIIIMA